jgi:hypothetical protein
VTNPRWRQCPGGSGKAEGFADGGWAKTIGKLTLAAATQV